MRRVSSGRGSSARFFHFLVFTVAILYLVAFLASRLGAPSTSLTFFGRVLVDGFHLPLAGAFSLASVLLGTSNGHEHGRSLEKFSALTCKA